MKASISKILEMPPAKGRRALEIEAERAELAARDGLLARELATILFGEEKDVGAQKWERPSAPLTSEWIAQWMSLETAARKNSVGRDKMLAIAQENGLCQKFGGTWQVDANRLKAFRAVRPYPPIPTSAEQ